jgi:hypothetical protein
MLLFGICSIVFSVDQTSQTINVVNSISASRELKLVTSKEDGKQNQKSPQTNAPLKNKIWSKRWKTFMDNGLPTIPVIKKTKQRKTKKKFLSDYQKTQADFLSSGNYKKSSTTQILTHPNTPNKINFIQADTDTLHRIGKFLSFKPNIFNLNQNNIKG